MTPALLHSLRQILGDYRSPADCERVVRVVLEHCGTDRETPAMPDNLQRVALHMLPTNALNPTANAAAMNNLAGAVRELAEVVRSSAPAQPAGEGGVRGAVESEWQPLDAFDYEAESARQGHYLVGAWVTDGERVMYAEHWGDRWLKVANVEDAEPLSGDMVPTMWMAKPSAPQP